MRQSESATAVWYLDTSAALKLLIQEAGSDALTSAINLQRPTLISSLLLETELRRAGHRGVGVTQQAATALLARVTLVEAPASLFREAGLLPGSTLGSLDALHLATAIRLDVDALVTYDHRLADAAQATGLGVLSPA